MKNAFMMTALVSLVLGSAFSHATCKPGTITETKPNAVLRINSDTTVTDKETGLVWMKCSQGQSGDDCAGSATAYTWEGALAEVQAANLAMTNGYSDWRLPSVAELGSLIESSCYNPAVNALYFPATDPSAYWSSSPVFDIANSAWAVDFYEGEETPSAKNAMLYVRLVRN